VSIVRAQAEGVGEGGAWSVYLDAEQVGDDCLEKGPVGAVALVDVDGVDEAETGSE